MELAWLMVIYKFLSSMRFFGPLAVLYFKEWLGIGYEGVFLSQIAFMIGTFLFEIPTGWVADKFGRKVSVMLGSILTSILTLVFLTRSFLLVVIAQFMIGFSGTLISGADKALLYDVVKKDKRKWMARLNAASTLGVIVAHIVGPLLVYVFGYPQYLPISFVFAGISIFISGFFLMPLPNPKGEVGNALEEGLNGIKSVMAEFRKEAMAWMTFLPASFFIFWLYQSFLPDAGLPIGFLGTVSAGFNLLSIIGSHIDFGVIIPSILSGLMYFLFPSKNLWLLLVAVFTISFLRASKMTTLHHIVTEKADKRRRATILSTFSLLESFARSGLYLLAILLSMLSENLIPITMGTILLLLGVWEIKAFPRKGTVARKMS